MLFPDFTISSRYSPVDSAIRIRDAFPIPLIGSWQTYAERIDLVQPNAVRLFVPYDSLSSFVVSAELRSLDGRLHVNIRLHSSTMVGLTFVLLVPLSISLWLWFDQRTIDPLIYWHHIAVWCPFLIGNISCLFQAIWNSRIISKAVQNILAPVDQHHRTPVGHRET